MKELTETQAATLMAFIVSFELHTAGVWATICQAMNEEWGIEDPEAALEDARAALEA